MATRGRGSRREREKERAERERDEGRVERERQERTIQNKKTESRKKGSYEESEKRVFQQLKNEVNDNVRGVLRKIGQNSK